MITHCPSCHTHFRVHPGQLAARAGQVRCGKCGRVFDALEHLIEESVPVHAPQSKHGPDAERAGTTEAEQLPEPAVAETDPILGEAQQPAIMETAFAQTEAPAPPKPPEPEAKIAQLTGVMPEKPGPVRHDSDAAGAFHFGPAARPAQPKRRWVWLTAAMLLLLLAQAAYQFRGTLILLFPETKPYASALCARLGCDLPLPRRIDLMSIEASDLQADTNNPNVMVLSATLRNRAIFSQQHPLLELTLTDAQDLPLVRRVLSPQDYLGRAISTQAGFGANTELAIKVFIEGSQIKATGYRLYLFYP